MSNFKKKKKQKKVDKNLQTNIKFTELVESYGLKKYVHTFQDYFELNFEASNKDEIWIIFNLQNIQKKNNLYELIIKNLIYFRNLEQNKYSYKFIIFKNLNNSKFDKIFFKISKKITQKVFLGLIFDNLVSKKYQVYFSNNKNYSFKILSNIFIKKAILKDEVKNKTINKFTKVFINNIKKNNFSTVSLKYDYFLKSLKHNLDENFLYNLFFILENNLVLSAKLVCEPFLEKHKLFFKKDDGNTIKKDTRLMMEILTYSDKRNDLLDISNLYNENFIYMHKLYNKLKIKRIIY